MNTFADQRYDGSAVLNITVCDCVLISERRYISDSYSGNTSEPLIWSQSYFSVIDTQS